MKRMSKRESPECVALGRWLQNELDVIETYKLAIQRMGSGAAQLEGAHAVMADHEEHAAELRQLLGALGRRVLGAEAEPHPCTRERLAIVGLEGDRVLDALLSNERRRLEAYEAALQRPTIAPLVAQLVERSIDAERRHVERLSACRAARAAA